MSSIADTMKSTASSVDKLQRDSQSLASRLQSVESKLGRFKPPANEEEPEGEGGSRRGRQKEGKPKCFRCNSTKHLIEDCPIAKREADADRADE